MKQNLKFGCILFAGILLITGCKKDKTNPPAVPPVAIAGNSQTIQLPVNTVTITGSGTTTNGSIVGYLWSLVSGPNVPVITSPGSTTTSVNGLIAGNYIFQLAVSDNIGLTGYDTISVLVKPALQQTIAIQPANNSNEGHVDNYNNIGASGDTEIPIGAWTAFGNSLTWRQLLKFDISQVPAGATILSATLFLYAIPNPHGGDLINAHSGTANAYYIETLATNWTFTGMTWANQPATNAVNRVTVPQSNSAFEDNTINVTALVADMQTNGNFGFEFRLLDENIYNIRQYASSYYIDAALHPKLVITFQ